MSKKIRIGNDINVTWSVLKKDKTPYPINSEILDVYMVVNHCKVDVQSVSVSGNRIFFTYFGKDQSKTGSYALVLVENKGNENMIIHDVKNAFTLVPHSWQEEYDDEPANVLVESVLNNDIIVPDEETITSDISTGIIGLKNRIYDESEPNGLGYIILSNDKTFAEQVTDSDTIYEIRYDFDLRGTSVTIPAGCVLKFVGGSISNGTITGNGTQINAGQSEIFSALTISGTWLVNSIYSCWFQKDKYAIENVMALNNPAIFSEIYIDGDYDVYVRKTNVYGIDIVSNTTVHISGTLTKDATSVTSTSSLFTISGENISIIGGCIDGNKTAFSDPNEYGFGFYIEDSFGVQIDSVVVRNCHGDGIYIGGTELNKNFNVRNCEIYGCRRNGISVIYAQNILIAETFIHDISGTAPGAAIDVEPNYNYQLCKNLVMRNCIIENCVIGIALNGTNADIENSFFENVRVEFEDYAHLIFLSHAIRTNFVNCTFNTTGARSTTYAVTGAEYSYACFENCAFIETGTAPAVSYYNAIAGHFIKCRFDIISSTFMDTLDGDFLECIFNCENGFCNFSSTRALGALVQRCQITAKGDSSIKLQGRTDASPSRKIKIIDCVLNLTPTYYPINVQYAEDIEISGCKMQISGDRNLISVFNSRDVRINWNTIIVGSNISVIAFTSSSYGQANGNIITAAEGVTLTNPLFVGINTTTSTVTAPGIPFYYEAEHKMLMNNGTSIVNLDGSSLT